MDDQVSAEDVRAGIQRFVDTMAPVSLALVRLEEENGELAIVGRGSGLLVAFDTQMLVVSCAHVLTKGVWGVEIRTETSPATSERQVYKMLSSDRRTPVRRLPAANTLGGDQWDFAWTTLQQGNGPNVIGHLHPYKGPMDRLPVDGEAYGFISWNRDALLPLDVLDREPSYEVAMAFAGEDEQGMYRFRLEGTHKGHPFYRGASGAPIADAEGAVVGLVANGEEAEHDIIKAVPFAKSIAAALGR